MMTKTAEQTSAERMLDEMHPATHPMRGGQHLRKVGAALTALEAAEENLRESVAQAHDAGDSWTAIGAVLGTSRQAAHRKYAAH